MNLHSTPLENDFNRLNEEQKAIIEKFNKNSLIIAGPGTGKTRTISVLIAKQLEKGTRLKEILALTFSDKAATELRNRVLEYYPKSFDQCWISTFHSFCARLLKEQYYEVGISPDFKLLNAFKESLLMSFICIKQDPNAFTQYGKVLCKRGFQQEVSTLIGLLKSNLVTPDDFEEAIKNANLTTKSRKRCIELLSLYKQYEKERTQSNYLDYRDLIVLSIKALSNPRIAENYRKKFKVILIDEFQDTDPAQFLLLTLLKGEGNDIRTAVIGDPRQSIYRFRGADPSMMTPKGPFKQKYKARVFPLNINYRSAKSIVEAATKLDWSEKLSTDGQLNPKSPDEGFIKYYKVRDEIEEARLLSRQIANYIIYGHKGKKYKPSDIAILVRNNYQIDLLAECLQSLHIPYCIADDMKFFKAEEIITLVSLLKIAGATKPDIKESSLQKAFLSHFFGLNPLWAQSIISEINTGSTSINSVIEKIEKEDFDSLPETDEANKAKAIEFAKTIRSLEKESESEISKVISVAISSVLNFIENPSEVTSRNVFHLRNMLADYTEVFSNTFSKKPLISDLLPELDEWINYYALNIELNQDNNDEEAVKVMTVHQSKGLEFPITVVSGLCEGLFPVNLRENLLLGTSTIEKLKDYFDSKNRVIKFFNPYPINEEEQLEEERRLFFVAATRAKEGLILTAPMRLGTDPTVVAPFFKEAGLKAEELEKDDRILTVSEFRTALTGLSKEELSNLEPRLIEAEKQIPKEYAIHGIRPRIFNKAKHDSVELPENFSFSATSLKNYLDCPRKFFFSNVLGINNPLDLNKPHIVVGNAYHRVLEELHRPDSLWEQGKEPSDEELLRLFDKYATPMIESIPFFERLKLSEEIKKHLLIYRDSIFKNAQLPCRHTKNVEEKFVFSLGGSLIKGRFDRIALIDEESIQIIDYKTTKSNHYSSEKIFEKAFPRSESIEDQIELQMPIYLLACQKLGYKRLSASLLYIMTEPYKKNYKEMKAGYQKSAALNLGCGPVYGKEVSKETLDSFEDRLTKLIVKIKNDRTFESKPSTNEEAKTCLKKDECDFLAFCQVGREIAREKAEKGAAYY